MRKGRGQSFQSWIDHRYERPEYDILILKQNDQNQIERCIEAHIGLTASIVSRYVVSYPDFKDDILGSALLGLVKAVNDYAKNPPHDNITGYICVTVHGHIQACIEHLDIVRLPRSQIRIAKKAGKSEEEIEKLFIKTRSIHDFKINGSSDPEDDNSSYEEWNAIANPQQIVDEIEHNNLVAAVEEILKSLPRTRLEQYIIQYRREGFTDDEIARKLYLTKRRIGQVRQDLYARFLQEWEKNV